MASSDELTRSEILFVYEVVDANPNGDPTDENRPRMDSESGRAKVSDVRLKRTIRDYLYDRDGLDIFCREIEKDDGSIQDGKARAEDFFSGNVRNVIEKRNSIELQVTERCIDVRLFGATIPVEMGGKGSSVTLTGPVQFAMGSSLHRVEPLFIKGTGAFASGQRAQQRTFREEYVLPYALIGFYGIVNQHAATSTKLTSEDVERLFKAMWFGTNELITRSKIGQSPLLLMVIEYKRDHDNAYIGRLDRFLRVVGPDGGDVRGESLRSTGEFRMDVEDLAAAIKVRRHEIERIRYEHDDRLRLSTTFDKRDGEITFAGVKAERFGFSPQPQPV
jgi:CRISPR-associated protein Csh2